MANVFKVIRIPYMFRKIHVHLDREDLSSCSRVNRYWFSLFHPLVWHTLAFSDKSHCKDLPPFSKNHVKTISPLSVNTRELHSHDCQSLFCFNGPRSRCDHLLELDFTACLTHESTAEAAQLIQHNPELERLTIHGDFTLTERSDTPQNLFSVLFKHPTLEHLQLESVDIIDYEYVRALLAHLPQRLQSLVVSWTSITSIDPDQFHASNPSWPAEYPRLQHLSFDTEMRDGTHEHILFPLLRRCPELKDVTISHMNEWTALSADPSRPSHELASLLRKHCPRLCRLSVNGCQESEVLAQNLEGIEVFQIGNSPSLGQLSTAIATHWSSSLRELSFLRRTSVQSADNQLILTTCPLLTKFVVWPDKIRYDINGIAQQGCSGLKLSEMTSSSWVCLGLEQLGLRILDDRSVREGTTTEEQNQSTVMMRQALAQIGDLALLQRLGLEWTPVSKIDVKTTLVPKDFVLMDFSLSCGINLLSGLKQLRKLQISVRELNVGQREMEWILENWPKLTAVAGLSGSYVSLCSKSTVAKNKDKEPAHIAWLRNNRSCLTLL